MAIPGIEKLEGVQEPFKSAILQMIEASGGRLYIKSGYRDHAHQQQLWADALAKYGDPEVADNWVARPGTSNHEHGWAVDLGFSGKDAIKWAHENAGQFGLMFPLANENWHIEWAGDRAGGQQPQSGGMMAGQMPWQGGMMYDLNYMDPAQNQNPQDVLANRLHSMLSIIGLDAASAGPGVSVTPQADPGMNVLQETPEIKAAGGMVPDAGPRMLQARRLGGMVDTKIKLPELGVAPAGGGAAPLSGAGMPQDPHGYGAYAWKVAQSRGWSMQDFLAWVALGNEESGTGQSDTHIVAWDPNAANDKSTAYGIGQFLDSTWGSVGGSKTSDPFKQIDYMAEYMARRYGNPRNALDFHHRNNWY